MIKVATVVNFLKQIRWIRYVEIRVKCLQKTLFLFYFETEKNEKQLIFVLLFTLIHIDCGLKSADFCKRAAPKVPCKNNDQCEQIKCHGEYATECGDVFCSANLKSCGEFSSKSNVIHLLISPNFYEQQLKKRKLFVKKIINCTHPTPTSTPTNILNRKSLAKKIISLIADHYKKTGQKMM